MIRKFLVPAAAFVAAAPVLAADLASPPVYPPAVPLFTWTGLYLGGQIGYGWGTDRLTVSPFGFGTNFTPNGVVGGGHIGYNLQLNQFVAGLEGDIEGTDISRSFSPGGVRYDTSIPVQGSIRGRLGVPSAAASNMPSPAIGRSGPNTASRILAASRLPRPSHSASARSSIITRPKTPFARASATNSVH
jgi:opacity protein-like surface antigen